MQSLHPGLRGSCSEAGFHLNQICRRRFQLREALAGTRCVLRSGLRMKDTGLAFSICETGTLPYAMWDEYRQRVQSSTQKGEPLLGQETDVSALHDPRRVSAGTEEAWGLGTGRPLARSKRLTFPGGERTGSPLSAEGRVHRASPGHAGVCPLPHPGQPPVACQDAPLSPTSSPHCHFHSSQAKCRWGKLKGWPLGGARTQANKKL